MDTRSEPPKRYGSARMAAVAKRNVSERKIVAVGRPQRFTTDAYVRALEMKWRHLILLFALSFLSFNLAFATLYWIQPDSLGNGSKGESAQSFLDAFFFSVQTVATIGYGVLFPKTLYANILVTGEIMSGVLGIAMVTGLMFARFSRPTARVMFSNVAVIAQQNSVPTLMFRAANQRHNLILEAHVRMALTRFETSVEGRTMRRFRDMEVERDSNLTFVLSWTVMHPITELSPLYGMTPEDLAASGIEIIVIVTGTDESFAQPVYARHVYAATDIIWDRHFVDIIDVAEDGTRIIDYSKFHDVEEAAVQ